MHYSNRPQAIVSGSSRFHMFSNYDRPLFWISFLLLTLGLIMMTSSSVTASDRLFGMPLYYFWRQSIAIIIGVILGVAIVQIPMQFWRKISLPLFILGMGLLVLVLIPGIGREVNGSSRWIMIGPFSFQSSEFMKFFAVCYLAHYLVKYNKDVSAHFSGFIRPLILVFIVIGLLLAEPDFGVGVVIFMTTLAMLFVGGVPILRFISWFFVCLITFAVLAILSPYRWQRLTSFMDPWMDPYNSGFQLTQALIAFGRGEWFGTGLGGSVQKLFYLPEAHTDFMFAVLAEELGVVGSIATIILFLLLVWRAFVIGYRADTCGNSFAAFFAYGISVVIGLQSFINIGVNMGLLPTKGLTLPLMSYGGSSMLVSCMFLAILFRIEYENRRGWQSRRSLINEYGI